MRKAAVLTILLAGAVQAQAGESIFAAPNDENTPAVKAYYERQCKAWADENGLQGEARESYLKSCQADMPKVLPVGWDPAED